MINIVVQNINAANQFNPVAIIPGISVIIVSIRHSVIAVQDVLLHELEKRDRRENIKSVNTNRNSPENTYRHT